MKERGWNFFSGYGVRRLFNIILILLPFNKVQAQCGTLTQPGLFGLSLTSIYCKNQPIQIGVFNSDVDQYYYFSVYRNGVEVARKGGPLDGNGSTLSVAAVMRSAQDAGEYRVRTYDDCGNADSTSYYAFYGNIDNLSITNWGSSTVKFRWAASGPRPAVTYEYAVTTQSNPALVTVTSTTTDTTATVSGLTNGTQYYIHVRVSSVVWNGNDVFDEFSCSGDGTFPWQTIRFTSCSSSTQTLGLITPANSIGCVGSNVTLTATGGSTYQWYREDNSQIAGATSATYNATLPGQYRVYITTGTTCQGMAASATVLQTSIQTSTIFASNGDYYSGDTIRFGVNNTVNGQTYKILKDGVEVYSMPGIGNPEQSNSPDSIWYKFVITSAAQAGVYSLRITSPYCTSVDVMGTLTVNFITGVTICPNSNTSFTFSSTGNNTTFRWQVDPNTGTFSNISNGGVYSGATTKTLAITNAPATMYGYKYRCVCTGGTPITSTTRTLKFGVTWTGTSSTNWSTASNWSCGIVPNANTDVIVQPGTNLPVIGSDVTCRSVLVKTGATLKVNSPAKLTITGQ